MAPPPARDNPFTRSLAGLMGMGFLGLMLVFCVATLPWTLGRVSDEGGNQTEVRRYDDGNPRQGRLSPIWVSPDAAERERLNALVKPDILEQLAAGKGVKPDAFLGLANRDPSGAEAAALSKHWDARHRPIENLLGTDPLGRSLLVRCMTGGGISLGIGIAAALLSVFIGTMYGAIAAYAGGKVDAVMMRIVDVLYGLPYILLVVLLAVASDAMVDEYVSRGKARQAWVDEQVAALAGLTPTMDSMQRELAKKQTKDRPASELPGLVPIAVEVLQTDWDWQREKAKEEQRRQDRALAQASTETEKAQARERQPVRTVPPNQPSVAEAASYLARAGTTQEALRALGGMAVRARELSQGSRMTLDVVTLLVAIGGVSWLTMSRVIRGQVLSLKAQPFMEAARAMGVPWTGQFARHLLPNLLGPIIVYTTLTVPQAILQESFLSFLGIGVKPPLPSWGNLAADGLVELNTYKSHWWLLVFPCVLLGTTLLALNFVGEGLREAFDPKRGRRG